MSNNVEFPRQPYSGQRLLGESIFSACENGSTAIFESPTGTGKSLAVLCGALSYLKTHDFNALKVAESIKKLRLEYEKTSTDKSISNEEKFKQMHELRCQLDKFEDQQHRQGQIDRYLTDSAEEALRKEHQQYSTDNDENEPPETQEPDDIVELGKSIRKLVYVSRTHSQLTQFIREMNNPLHKAKRPVQIGSRASLCLNPNVNSMPAALVNCECARLVKNSASTDIEDIGLGEDAESSSTKKQPKADTCPFYKRSKILELRSKIWNGVLLDSQTTLKEEGQKLGACPYFAAKAAVPLCDVVAMPYNILFDKVLRNSYGIDAASNVVIVDEAHNFLNTVYETASFTLSLSDLELAKKALEYYLNTTRSTRQDKLLSIRQIISALERFNEVLESKKSGDIKMLKPVEIQRDMATTVDFLKLASLIETGGLLRESRGILSRYWSHSKRETTEVNAVSSTSSLSALVSRVRQSNVDSSAQKSKTNLNTPEALKRGTKRVATPRPTTTNKQQKTDSNSTVNSLLNMPTPGSTTNAVFKTPIDRLHIDGVQLFGSLIKLFRALLQTDAAKFIFWPKDGRVRYIRLDIDSDLQNVIKSAKTFIMVGGTMRPSGYISSVLKTSCKISHVFEQHFGHVIPPQNLLPVVVSRDSQGNPLNLKVSQLNSTILDRYAQALCELFKHIPYGCVVFLPNYNLIMSFEKLLTALKPQKQLFVEKRGQDPEELMRKYSQAAQGSRNGAILIASASGRLGEGINFSDNMARAIIMCGLPYPNAMDAEIKLRASHAVEQKLCSNEHEFLLQTCTRVVAQCMGRAIRHSGDFATLIFMDSRYELNQPSNDVVSNLPEWMTQKLRSIDYADYKPIFNRFFQPLLSKFDSKRQEK
ncbi:DEAD2 domain containing protein [Aphelenchoides bicaudatus]|nr:DEAD2 domain containing protein [Aphelenchoides bicaudatus]